MVINRRNKRLSYCMIKHMSNGLTLTTDRSGLDNALPDEKLDSTQPDETPGSPPSHPLSGYFCNDALQLILNIAAENDPWFKEHGLHSERILPKFFLMPNATTMSVDLSIDSAILPLPPRDLVSMMTDVKTWASRFSHIVYSGKGEKPSGTSLEILDIQKVTAEFLKPISVVPFSTIEKITFLRFVKEIRHDMWAVVDLDFDECSERLSRMTIGTSVASKPKVENACRRKPSGVIIAKYDDSKSKVIWIETMEFPIDSDWPFKAYCWINVLKNDYRRMSSDFLSFKLGTENEGSRGELLGVLKEMAKNIRIKYVDSIVASADRDGWSGHRQENKEIWLKHKLNSQGPYAGSCIFVAVVKFNVESKTSRPVFSYLREKNLYIDWCHTRITQWTDEVIRVASPDGDTYCITLNKDPFEGYVLQEASTDGFRSFVISSPIKESDFDQNLSKNEWSELVLYPSGFTIVPDMNLCISISLQLMDSTQQDAIKAMQQFHLDLIAEIEQEIFLPKQSGLQIPLSDYFKQAKPDCAYFLKTGRCKFGSKCAFNHPSHVLATTSGVASENDEASSIHEERTEECSCSATYKGKHPRREDHSQN
ncbi:homeobox-leucine zipper protein ROC7 isoform X1 [Gossypium hirsutum]|uniref:Homeobox-leucine zipper protein ROC7 isoform X1 n=1 Tax=Gossypium hirsutum TaxID=3635 RepID=A0ABM3C053_GOSHI|nr:homeobox-leucine zipper protein ROC7-like isoform X1 [Gossypium hirsutum]